MAPRDRWSGLARTGALAALALLAPEAAAQAEYAADVEFAAQELGRRCEARLSARSIDWEAASAPLREEAKAVRSDAEHLLLLTRLIARLSDGRAQVLLLEGSEGLELPPDPRGERTGAGMSWCRIGGRLYLKNTWNDPVRAGFEPGMEVLSVDGVPAADWLAQRIETIRGERGFASEQHALFFACHQGLADFQGTRRTLEVETPKKRRFEREMVYRNASPSSAGPAFPLEGLEPASAADVRSGMLAKKWGYVHVLRTPADLCDRLDQALARVEEAKGLVLDLRGNAGAALDGAGAGDALEPAALLGRFVPAKASFGDVASAGKSPFGGPLVVLVDGSTCGAGETIAQLFLESGRAYLLGESATAGSAAKTESLELPSKRFALQFSAAGDARDGVGIAPHRVVELERKDLVERVDTLVRVATEVLAKFPQREVRYDPKAHGWKK